MTAKEQKQAAVAFAVKWAGRGYEKGECQKFWRGLLHDVFGVANPDDWIQYEVSVATGFAKMSKGSQPTDGGFLMLTPDEREAMIGTQFPWWVELLGLVFAIALGIVLAK